MSYEQRLMVLMCSSVLLSVQMGEGRATSGSNETKDSQEAKQNVTEQFWQKDINKGNPTFWICEYLWFSHYRNSHYLDQSCDCRVMNDKDGLC